MPLQFDKLTASGFTGQIILPDDEAWTSSTQAWGAQSRRSPKAALQPRSAEDVSKAILWLNEFKLDFAVRSGGMAESQSDDVIVDLSLLNRADYDAENNFFRVGPGQSWGNFYKKIEHMDVTVLGGRVGFVGVGGFLLGGGLSYLSSLHGLAADSVLDAQVVLGDGSIVWARNNEDLFFGLKGAGHALGVVTEFVLRAYPKPASVFSGFLIFTLDKFQEICEHMSELATNNIDPKVNALVGVIRAPPDMHHIIGLLPLVFESAEYAKKALSWAWELGPVQDLSGIMTYEQTVAVQDMFIKRPISTGTFQQDSLVVSKLTPAIMQTALDWQIELQKDPRFHSAIILFQPFFPGCFASDSTKTAWPHSSTALHVVGVVIEEPDAGHGHAEENAGHIRACMAAMEKVADPDTILPKYPNYALVGTPAIAFYGRNLPRLQEIKKKLDPENRFNKGIKLI